jgi:hypothetical protein
MIRAMPSRTDDPARTRPEIEVVPDSPRAAAPTTRPALEVTDVELITEESFRAVLSSHQRAGRWEPAEEIHVLAVAGEVTLDFTRALLPPSGVIEIDAQAIAGAITIIVPDGAEIELDGTPFLGSIEQTVRKKGAAERIREWVTGERNEDLPSPALPAEPPLFRVDGRAICGTITVMGR